MAGDWIKMRTDLADDPAVIRMANFLQMDSDTIVGKLHRLWSWADRHLCDGNAPGVTDSWINRYVGCEAFGAAMESAGWLEIDDAEDGQEVLGVRFPNFERHNGETGKQRSLTAKRVANHRANGNGKSNAPIVTPALAREEKRREEKSKGDKPPNPLSIPAELDTPEFHKSWSDWLRYRRERKTKTTPTMLEKQLALMAGIGADRAVAGLEYTMAMGWQGFREDDRQPAGGNGKGFVGLDPRALE